MPVSLIYSLFCLGLAVTTHQGFVLSLENQKKTKEDLKELIFFPELKEFTSLLFLFKVT